MPKPVISLGDEISKEFEISTSYPSNFNKKELEIKDTTHKITCKYSRTINVFDIPSYQRYIENVNPSANFIAKVTDKNAAGIAILEKDVLGSRNPPEKRIHFSPVGAVDIEEIELNSIGKDLFLRTVKYAMGESLIC